MVKNPGCYGMQLGYTCPTAPFSAHQPAPALWSGHRSMAGARPVSKLERGGLARNQKIWLPGVGGESDGVDHDCPFVPGSPGADRADRRRWELISTRRPP